MWQKANIVNVRGLGSTLGALWRTARGNLRDEWTLRLFPETGPSRRREYIRWARVLLIGHGLILGVSLYFRLWMLPVVLTFAKFYGTWLRFLCNETQHVGLRDKVPDFRLCCRTICLNPFLRFLYWHMNYHIEHHMYAAIPCYNLRRLHALMKDQLPPTPDGLVATWTQIGAILKRQKQEPDYQFTAALPPREAEAK